MIVKSSMIHKNLNGLNQAGSGIADTLVSAYATKLLLILTTPTKWTIEMLCLFLLLFKKSKNKD